MSYSEQVATQARNELAKRRNKAENTAAEHRRALGQLCPEYKTLERTLISCAKELVGVVGVHDKKEINRRIQILNEKVYSAHREIDDMLRAAGLPENYLDEQYTCPVCRDSGVTDNKRCECLKQLLRRYAFEELSAASPLKISTFDDFSLSYYPAAQSEIKNGTVREGMTEIFEYCKSYADNFDRDNPSIFMYGETGLGKTHLSLAIAGEVIKKGYGVVYGSCHKLFSRIEAEKFGRAEGGGDTEAMLCECDLLILDDLGSEFSTQFTTSVFYNIVNTRMLCSLPTVISSNLSLQEFEQKYTKRVTSRIIGEYQLLCFEGRDIRQIKKYGAEL